MKLRYYQRESIDAIYEYFDAGNVGNPILALPTGTGKSVIPAVFQKEVLQRWPNQRFLNLVHNRELVGQNYQRMLDVWPDAPAGLNSASLRRRDTENQLLFAGIGSVAKNPKALGWRDLVIVDEAHMISPKAETQYQTTLQALLEINPNLKVIGLTATPYRMGMGMITDGGLFTDIAYDITSLEAFNRLIDEGYLAPLYPKQTNTQIDRDAIKITGGEFQNKAMNAVVNTSEVTRSALLEVCEHGWDRKCWLLFAAGVEHAENLATALNEMGVPTAAIHSKMTTQERDRRIEAYKRGELRCLTNNDVLTTGFDHPPIDLIGMFRPTQSPALWVQMLGRGTRPYAGKHGCLVLDFAKNTAALGPVNDPVIPKRKGKGGGDAPVKICEECGTYNHTRAPVCIMCGHEFPKYEKIESNASTKELISHTAKNREERIELVDVNHVVYSKHVTQTSKGPLDMLKCVYHTPLGNFPEYIILRFNKGRIWWSKRHPRIVPKSVDEALTYTNELRVPHQIKVHLNAVPKPKILDYEY